MPRARRPGGTIPAASGCSKNRRASSCARFVRPASTSPASAEAHNMKRLWRMAFFVLAAIGSVAVAAEIARQWQSLGSDGVHDPNGPGLRYLQQPREALSQLPYDGAGNQVDWIRALEQGKINPRTNIRPETNVRILDTDVLLNLNGSTPIV